MRVETFDKSHLSRIDLQDRQRDADTSGDWIVGPAWTVFDGERIAGMGGFLLQWDGRFLAWAMIAKGANMVGLTRIARSIVNGFNVRRIEATIDVNFRQAAKWVSMLGFEFEGVLRCAGLNGEDFAMYSKVVR
jgi:hypothetical protein